MKDSWLSGCDPTVKAGVLFAASVALQLVFEPLPLLALHALVLVAVRAAARVGWGTLALAQAPFALFGLGLVVINALARPGEPLLPDAPLRVTVEGLSVGAALALRGLVIGALAVGFLASTPPRELMTSLVAHARLSPRYAFALLAGQRMLAGMPRTWSTISAAHAVRAPLRADGTPRRGIVGFARQAFGLLVAAIRSAERVALALESRGVRDGPRTAWRPARLGSRDAVLVIVAVLLAAAVLAGDELV